jgi:multiple sugar transport system substrate-binding protein
MRTTAGLSFIGLGAQPPTADWGTMLAGRTQLDSPRIAAARDRRRLHVIGKENIMRLTRLPALFIAAALLLSAACQPAAATPTPTTAAPAAKPATTTAPAAPAASPAAAAPPAAKPAASPAASPAAAPAASPSAAAAPSPATAGGGVPAGVAKPASGSLTIAAVQGSEDAPLKAIAPRYQQQYGVQVNIVEFPYDQLYEKLVTTFQANTPTYDLIMMDDPWMPKFGTNDWLQPLEGNYGFTRDPDIPGVVYDVGTWPPPRGPVPPTEKSKAPHLLGITIVGNVEMFMYRKDMGEAPKTWDDVLANAQKNNKSGFAGYVIRGKATNPVVADFLPILWSFGGDVFDDNWKEQVDSPASITAAKFLVEQLKAAAEPGAENVDAADRDRLIAINQGYQSTVWPAEVTDVVENPQVSQVVGKIGYIPIPAGRSGKGFGNMGNWLLGVPKATQNGQAAADFIKWLTSAQIQRDYVGQGGIPSRKSLLTDPSLNQKDPFFSALAQSLDATPNWRPRTDQWNAVETILGTQLNSALAGLTSAEDAMKTAAEQITSTMQQAGY